MEVLLKIKQRSIIYIMIKKDNKRIIITLSQTELEKLKTLSNSLGYKTYTKAIRYLINNIKNKS